MRRLLAAVVIALAAATASAQSGPWFDLGFALPGIDGLPHLSAKGPLTAGSPLSIELTHAAPHEDAYLVIGFSAIFAPYKGGVLVPAFDLLFELPTTPLGEVSLVGHWPAGVPAGLPFVMQFWIDDDAAVAGRAGSNAVGALTP